MNSDVPTPIAPGQPRRRPPRGSYSNRLSSNLLGVEGGQDGGSVPVQANGIVEEEIAEIKRYEVDWVQDAAREELRRRARERERTAHPHWGGAAIGLNAAFLNIVTEWLSDIKRGYCTTAFYLNENFCCWGAENAGSGISEIKCIIAGFVMKGFLGFWTLIIKSIGLPLAIASGLSVGKEGPSVHYAVCTGNVISQLFEKYKRNAAKSREILTACAAAGVGVAFGSPIGGVLFSLEEISSYFPLKTLWRSYFCALVATAVLAAMNPFRTGQLVMFTVKYDRSWHFFELIFFVIIGIFGGLYGAFVMKWNLRVQAFRKKYLKDYSVIEATLLAATTAVVCYPNLFLRIDMTESMEILFLECEGGHDYGGLCQMVGILVQALHESAPDSSFFASCEPDVPCITPGTYAFLGAGAALSGIMHITVSVVVIMFELTGALTYILPTMIVVGVTKAVGDRFGKGGIADRMIWFNGFPFLDNKEEHTFGVPVSTVTMNDLTVIPSSGLDLTSLEWLLSENKFQGFPVVESSTSRVLVGYIGRTELLYAIERAKRERSVLPSARCFFGTAPSSTLTPSSTLRPPMSFDTIPSTSGQMSIDFSRFMNPTPLTVHPHLPLETVMEVFKKMGPRVILVEYRGQLTGLVTVKDCLKYQFKVEAEGNPRDDSSLNESQERLWRLMQHGVAWLREKASRVTGGQIQLGSPPLLERSMRSPRSSHVAIDDIFRGDHVLELGDR
ncbi:MAG: glycerol ethanol, ferric requiring protein [Lichina confinis]|nr:MAG: glycerol ethanol, ferric requiring protein [Lichina confinis]